MRNMCYAPKVAFYGILSSIYEQSIFIVRDRITLIVEIFVSLYF